MAAARRFTAETAGTLEMPEDLHIQIINRLEDSVRALGQRTGENEKLLAVHEAECALRYQQVSQALANLHEKIVESSTKQILLIRMVGIGITSAIIAWQAAKSFGLF